MALAKFNAGDEAGAITILDQLNDARDAALQKASDIQKAVGRRDEAQLALDGEQLGKISIAPVISLFEKVVALDPGVSRDWVDLAQLERSAGRLADARKAADQAVTTAASDPDRALALTQMGYVLAAQGDLPGALNTARQAQAIAERLLAASPNDPELRRGLAVSLMNVAGVQVVQGDLIAASQTYIAAVSVWRKMIEANPQVVDLAGQRSGLPYGPGGPGGGPRRYCQGQDRGGGSDQSAAPPEPRRA